jgi:hypothetical protein
MLVKNSQTLKGCGMIVCRKKFPQKEKCRGGLKGKEFDMTRVKCYNYQRKGHFARDCPKIKKGHKGKYRASIAAEDESQKMKTKGASSIQETRREYYLISALSGSLTNSDESWLVDSGASRHMTGNKGVLANFKEKKFSAQVELGDNASYAIGGIGSASFQLESGGELHIEEIMYCLGLKKNLIFVAVLEDKGYRVIFMDKKALLRPPKNEELSSTIVIGVREGGFYKLPGHIQALVHASVSPSKLSHRRFGHLHYKALPGLQKMVRGMPTFHFEHDGICRGCVLSKNTKKSFPNSNTMSKGILELINSNICGPMSSPSLNGCLYYVIFIDDFSRKSWIYFLKAKNETFSKFIEYKALIENQTGKHIHALRTDNGGEIESHQFDDFCKEAEIKKQLIVPYNPQ